MGRTTTDKSGHFTITGVPLGSYIVEASQAGLVWSVPAPSRATGVASVERQQLRRIAGRLLTYAHHDLRRNA